MKRSMLARVLPWMLLLFACPVLAHGQDAQPSQDQQQNGDEPTPGADAYTQRVRAGITQLTGGDTAGAIATFQEAVQLDGSRPDAPYYIATAQRMNGDLEAALTGFRQAASLAQAANLPRWRGRALSAVGFTLERMEGRIEDARTAWQAYSQFADTAPTQADPQLGRARVQAIDIMNEQEHAYVDVRQRIADREELHRQEAAEADHPRRGRRRH